MKGPGGQRETETVNNMNIKWLLNTKVALL